MCFVSVLCMMAEGQQNGGDRFQLLRARVPDERTLSVVVELDARRDGLEIWSDRVGIGELDVRASMSHRRILDRAGISYTLTVEDLAARRAAMFAGEKTGDFFASYRSYDEHVAFMEGLVAQHPTLASLVSLGDSVEGRPLLAIRITGAGAHKPGVLYHGAQHGNEVMGPCVIAYAARHLLTHYATDAEVAGMIDGVDWYLLPIMNPDGYEEGDRYNANQADLNRDWGAPGGDPARFAQPETAAVRDFLLSHAHVRSYLDLHSYGYMIMWPWAQAPEPCAHHALYAAIATEMRTRIGAVHGTDYDRLGPVNTTIYPVNGGSVDYVYGAAGLWAMTFEVGYGFYMPVHEILPMSEELLVSLLYLSSWTYDCNSNGVADMEEVASGSGSDCDGNFTLDACESETTIDRDGDGLVDRCDPDSDNDGILNEADACPLAPVGAPIEADGRPVADRDEDCDVGLGDYRRFDLCHLDVSEMSPRLLRWCADAFDYDGNLAVDTRDFAIFQRSFCGDQP